MAYCSLLSTHGHALLCIYRDPDIRLRDIAATLEITERRAYDIVNDLAEAGFVVRTRSGRRNHYEIQESRPLRETTETGAKTLGEVIALLAGAGSYRRRRHTA